MAGKVLLSAFLLGLSPTAAFIPTGHLNTLTRASRVAASVDETLAAMQQSTPSR